tara:strand:+ start:566 stop:796 length:231 start_codon:yes stop_codon:yes gene_type:complete
METINITLKLPEHQVAELEQFCREHFEHLLEFKVLPNTEEMYEADPLFRELNKAKKSHKTLIEKYINEHNNKHKNK